jgi:thiol-disulfide isomerase/thioredoxin
MNNWKSAIVAASLLVFATAAQAQVKKFEGKTMPAFSMKDVKTGKVYTNSSLKGKVVILDLWATWCGPCKMASPTMQRLHAKYAKQGLVVIGANVDGSDSVSAVKKYADSHKYSYAFTQGNDELSNKLEVQGIPAFLFIDKKGVVRRVATGFAPGQSEIQFEQVVRSLLASK